MVTGVLDNPVRHNDDAVMTQTLQHAGTIGAGSRFSRRQRRAIGALGVLSLLAGLWVGVYIGRHEGGVEWHTGSGYSSSKGASVEVDGWTYWIPATVQWDDANGFHEDGRPTCLPDLGAVENLRFAAVAIERTGQRVVAFLSCVGQQP